MVAALTEDSWSLDTISIVSIPVALMIAVFDSEFSSTRNSEVETVCSVAEIRGV